MSTGRFKKKKNPKKKVGSVRRKDVQIDLILQHWNDFVATVEEEGKAGECWEEAFNEQGQAKEFFIDKGFFDPIFAPILFDSFVFSTVFFKKLLGAPVPEISNKLFNTSFLAHSTVLKKQLDTQAPKQLMDYAEETHYSVFLFKNLSTNANFAKLDQEDQWLAMSLVRTIADLFAGAYKKAP